MRSRLLGAVLAGGEGRRFGGPKAAVLLDGVSLVERAVSILREAVGTTVVVSSRPVPPGAGPTIPDLTPDVGPLGGLEAALDHASATGHEGVLLLGCDLPLVSVGLVEAVAEALGDAPAAAPARVGQGAVIEPLCAAYRTSVLPAVRQRLTCEDRSLHALFRSVGGRVVAHAFLGELHPDALLNVNTREDLRRASRALARRRSARGGGPTVVCVVGKKKSGKTATTVGLMRELSSRGHRVMSAKHGHRFELDHEGTDSWRHRHEGGATRVAMSGPAGVAVMGEWGRAGEEPLEALVARYLGDADIVVAEGFKTSSARKIEVYRRAAHEEPLYGADPERDATYLAVLTDVPGFDAHVPVLDVDDPARFRVLADLVEKLRAHLRGVG